MQNALFKGCLSILLRIPDRTACTPALIPGYDTFRYYLHEIPETLMEKTPGGAAPAWYYASVLLSVQ